MPDPERAPHHARIARAERLGGQWRHGRDQSHSKSKTDEEHGVCQRRRCDCLAAETPDEGEIGRHHRDLPELCQRKGRGEAERLGKLEREMIAGRARA